MTGDRQIGDRQTLARWLAAEAGENETAAETELTRLFARLPRPRPAADFGDQVLARWIGSAVPATPTSAPYARRVWPWLAAAALLAAVSVPLRLPALLGVLSLIGPGELTSAFAGGVVILAELAPGAVVLWQLASELQQALLLLLATPQVFSTLIAGALAAALGYRFLHDHLTSSRSLSDAQSLSLAI